MKLPAIISPFQGSMMNGEILVQLYDGWDKKDKADEWRKKLEDQKKQ